MPREVPALHRAFDVLELFLEEPDLSPPEITARLELPRTTVHELIHTLLVRAYLAPSPWQPGKFRLGVRAFQLGSSFAERLDLATEGEQVARLVAAECGETVHVAVLDGVDVIYIAKVDSSHPVRMVSATGRRLPAHCTAVGKMLLANLPGTAFAQRFPPDQVLQAMTPHSVTSVATLTGQLPGIRDGGLAHEYCESNEAVACVAAPVHDHTGRVTAAMSISVPTLRWSLQRRAELGRLVAGGAAELSAALGYRG